MTLQSPWLAELAGAKLAAGGKGEGGVRVSTWGEQGGEANKLAEIV